MLRSARHLRRIGLQSPTCVLTRSIASHGGAFRRCGIGHLRYGMRLYVRNEQGQALAGRMVLYPEDEGMATGWATAAGRRDLNLTAGFPPTTLVTRVRSIFEARMPDF